MGHRGLVLEENTPDQTLLDLVLCSFDESWIFVNKYSITIGEQHHAKTGLKTFVVVIPKRKKKIKVYKI